MKLRPRVIDPITKRAVQASHVFRYSQEGHEHVYDGLSLALSLHAMGRAVDPVTQMPLEKRVLDDLDLHLRQRGVRCRSVRNVQGADEAQAARACEMSALEEQCGIYIEQMLELFEATDAPFSAFRDAPILLEQLLQHFKRICALDVETGKHLRDCYLAQLRGPPNCPTNDVTGFLLGLCLSTLRARADRILSQSS